MKDMNEEELQQLAEQSDLLNKNLSLKDRQDVVA